MSADLTPKFNFQIPVLNFGFPTGPQQQTMDPPPPYTPPQQQQNYGTMITPSAPPRQVAVQKLPQEQSTSVYMPSDGCLLCCYCCCKSAEVATDALATYDAVTDLQSGNGGLANQYIDASVLLGNDSTAKNYVLIRDADKNAACCCQCADCVGNACSTCFSGIGKFFECLFNTGGDCVKGCCQVASSCDGACVDACCQCLGGVCEALGSLNC